MRTFRSALAFALFASLLATTQPCLAKRSAPAPVAPLVIAATTYRAPHSPLGLVEAVDTQSGATLWTKQIFVTRYDPALERDVQDRFITSLRAAEGGLLITVEGGAEYFLNLTTLEVKRQAAKPGS